MMITVIHLGVCFIEDELKQKKKHRQTYNTKCFSLWVNIYASKTPTFWVCLFWISYVDDYWMIGDKHCHPVAAGWHSLSDYYRYYSTWWGPGLVCSRRPCQPDSHWHGHHQDQVNKMLPLFIKFKHEGLFCSHHLYWWCIVYVFGLCTFGYI